MTEMTRVLHTAIDAPDCRALAEFYRALLGLRYRPGDEPPAGSAEDDADWLVLIEDGGRRVLAFQQKTDTAAPTWPSEDVPMQMHLDFAVPNVEALQRQGHRAEELGARLLSDQSHDREEPLLVLADPAGHPFCLLVQAAPPAAESSIDVPDQRG